MGYSDPRTETLDDLSDPLQTTRNNNLDLDPLSKISSPPHVKKKAIRFDRLLIMGPERLLPHERCHYLQDALFPL